LFGGLLLGEDGPSGLEYRGRVGSGFSDRDLRALKRRLDELATERSPFTQAVLGAREVHWVRPELRVLVEYAERTSSGQLRSPVFRSVVISNDNSPLLGGRQDTVDALREQIEKLPTKGTLEGDDWTMALTNLDKELWPATREHPAVTKRDLLHYALAAWPAAERHLRDRLLTFARMPDGIMGERFYQRHWEGKLPPFLETVRVFSDSDGRDKDFLLCNNLPTLLWLCQVADVEWHIGLARVTPGPASTRFTGSLRAVEGSVVNRPDLLLFDLDPYLYRGDEHRGQEPQPGKAGFDAAKEAALVVKEVLDSLTLPSFVKTSGATGVHVVVPLQRTLDFAATRAAANTLAKELVARHPRLLTAEWDTRKRRGKVFLDANQNARHKAIAAPYSPRALPGAPVSMPISWAKLPTAQLGEFSIKNARAVVNAGGDEWAVLAAEAIDLAAALGLA
jgi:bifunctional non-homologous end joining protein LigD